MERIAEELNGRKTIYYKEGGKLHNPTGPARYTYFPTGKLKSLEYYVHGVMFRQNDLPNYIQFYESGKFFVKEWRNAQNQLHRLTGPAKIIYYDNDNDKPWKEFYIEGTYFPYWLPKVEFSTTKDDLTKSIIAKAIMFNREYGVLLKTIWDSRQKC